MANLSENRNQWLLRSDKSDLLPGIADEKYEKLDGLLDVFIPPISFGAKLWSPVCSLKNSFETKSKINLVTEEDKGLLNPKNPPKNGNLSPM